MADGGCCGREAPSTTRARSASCSAPRSASRSCYSATEVELLATPALARHPYLAKLGPDVLEPATSVRAIGARIADPRFARSSLAALLLDQRFIAGLGNYLRSEILHVARLARTLRPGDLDDAQRAALANAIHALPRQSYRTRGVTNDLAAARADRAAGVPFDEYRFRVYDRAGLAVPHVRRAGRAAATPPAAACSRARRASATRVPARL